MTKKTPKPIRRGDGKILKFGGYRVPSPNESSAEQIAMTLQRLLQRRGVIGPCDEYYREEDDNLDFGIDMGRYLQD